MTCQPEAVRREASPERLKIYRVLPDPEAEKDGDIRHSGHQDPYIVVDCLKHTRIY